MTGISHGLANRHYKITVEGGTGRAVRVAASQRIRIVNTLGRQVVDTWALSLPRGDSRLSMSHTRLAIGRLSPRVGDVLVDDHRQPLLHLVEDTSHGDHDTLIPACDTQRYRSLGHRGKHASCADNYTAAVAAFGLPAPAQVPDPLNLYMAVPVSAGGDLTLQPSTAASGSQVVFKAVREILLIVSACPQDLVPINATDGSPRLIELYIEPLDS